MKKSILAVAGLAAVAGIVAPIAGASAADPITSVKDSLTVTVSPSCTYDSISPEAATTTAGNAYAVTMAPNEVKDLVATDSATSLKVTCNDPDGYTITPTFSGLTHQGTTTASSHDIAYSGTAVSAGDQKWNALYSKNSAEAVIFAASGTAIEGASTMTDTYSFSYKVGTGVDQAADTYKGTATYVLAAK